MYIIIARVMFNGVIVKKLPTNIYDNCVEVIIMATHFGGRYPIVISIHTTVNRTIYKSKPLDVSCT